MTKKEFTNEELESKIKASFDKITPDIIDSIISDCEHQKGVVITMTGTNKSKKNKYIGIAAALAIMVGGIFGYQGVTSNALAASIMLDVNPSVEIKVNKNDDVIDVIAMNDDGRTIIGDMDFKGSDLDVTVNALVGSMLRNGYISEIQNSILVSVDGKDQAKNEVLQKKVSDEIDDILSGGGVKGAVLSQTVKSDSELKGLAEKYGITEGKAKLISELVAKDGTLTFEELAPLTINELNLLGQAETRKVETVKVTGTASDKAYIGRDKARDIAFADAGVTVSNVRDLEVEFDHENGVMIYEVEFDTINRDYEYDIDAKTGTILWSDKDIDGKYDDGWDDRYDDWDDQYDDDWDDFDDMYDDDDYVAPGTTDIGRDKALSIAYNHAGVSAGNVYDLECERDEDDGILSYEIEFKSGNMEYKYDINAADGSILEAEKDIDD